MNLRNLEVADYLEKGPEGAIPRESRLYQIDPAPPQLPFNEYISQYQKTSDDRYFLWFLHYYERTINAKAFDWVNNYAIPERWQDLKQVIVHGYLEAVAKYDPQKEADFLAVAKDIVEDAVHDYVRTMRTGFTINSRGKDETVRKAMRIFHEFGGRTDDAAIAEIAAAINRTPKFTRRLIRDACLNTSLADPVRFDEDGEEEELSQYAPDGTSDPARLFFMLQEKQLLYDAFYKLTLREQKIISDHLGFCPDCWTNQLRNDGRLLKRDFRYIGLTHEIQEKAAERAYHTALAKMRRKLIENGI